MPENRYEEYRCPRCMEKTAYGSEIGNKRDGFRRIIGYCETCKQAYEVIQVLRTGHWLTARYRMCPHVRGKTIKGPWIELYPESSVEEMTKEILEISRNQIARVNKLYCTL